MLLYFVTGAVIGGIFGGIIGWLWAARRMPAGDSRLESELRNQLAERDTRIKEMGAEVLASSAARASAEASRASAEKLLAEQRAIHEQALRETRAAQEKALADLRDAFRALSAEALQKTQPEFLRLANETMGKFQEAARGDLAQRQQAIATLVEPLKQHLETYQTRLQQSETAQAATLGAVRKQLEQLSQQSQALSTETLQLRKVLSSNQARGRWGEETLRRVVEAAGMSAHCDFSEQTQAGDGKPDLVVHLPGNRVIIVDAKVPDLEFLAAIDVADPIRRSDALVQHASKLKGTIKSLAERDYPRQFSNALDLVVLFLPAESLFSAALEGDRELMIWAQSKGIIIATPCSLIAILRSVSLSWQEHARTENARAIADAAAELFGRVVKFTEHLEKIRSGLERANLAFNEAVGSYERMVRPSGERVLRLGGAGAGKELIDLQPIDAIPRLASDTH